MSRELDLLAEKLGRPPTTLAAFRDLDPADLQLLADGVDRRLAHQRAALDALLAYAVRSAPLRRALGSLIRGRAR